MSFCSVVMQYGFSIEHVTEVSGRPVLNKTHNPSTISHLLNSKMRLMTLMLKHALREGSDVTAAY